MYTTSEIYLIVNIKKKMVKPIVFNNTKTLMRFLETNRIVKVNQDDLLNNGNIIIVSARKFMEKMELEMLSMNYYLSPHKILAKRINKILFKDFIDDKDLDILIFEYKYFIDKVSAEIFPLEK